MPYRIQWSSQAPEVPETFDSVNGAVRHARANARPEGLFRAWQVVDEGGQVRASWEADAKRGDDRTALGVGALMFVIAAAVSGGIAWLMLTIGLVRPGRGVPLAIVGAPIATLVFGLVVANLEPLDDSGRLGRTMNRWATTPALATVLGVATVISLLLLNGVH